MMVTWFRVLYTLVKEKIIGDRSWKETSEKINSAVLEDPIFKVGDLIIHHHETDHREKMRNIV